MSQSSDNAIDNGSRDRRSRDDRPDIDTEARTRLPSFEILGKTTGASGVLQQRAVDLNDVTPIF